MEIQDAYKQKMTAQLKEWAAQINLRKLKWRMSALTFKLCVQSNLLSCALGRVLRHSVKPDL